MTICRFLLVQWEFSGIQVGYQMCMESCSLAWRSSGEKIVCFAFLPSFMKTPFKLLYRSWWHKLYALNVTFLIGEVQTCNLPIIAHEICGRARTWSYITMLSLAILEYEIHFPETLSQKLLPETVVFTAAASWLSKMTQLLLRLMSSHQQLEQRQNSICICAL